MAQKRKKASLATKFTTMVLAVVLTAFFFIFFFELGTVYKYYRDLTLSSRKNQLEKTASQISTLQTTVENMGKQILYNDVVLTYLEMEEASTGEYLYAKRRVQRSLANYSYIIGGVQEIMIYTTDGRTLSSRDVKSPFQPEKNPWYEQFLERNVNFGFSAVHDSEPSSNGISVDVVSYIMTYYSVGDTNREMGKLIIDLDLSMIREMMDVPDHLLRSTRLLDWENAPLITVGEAKAEKEGAKGRLPSVLDDVELTTGGMADHWVLQMDIARTRLMKDAIFVNIRLFLLYGLILMILLVLLRAFIRKITDPIQKLSETATEVGSGNLNVSVAIHTGDELETLAEVFNQMVANLQKLMQESVEHEKIRRHMQIENLMLQINPHFIYNTMNSIVYMARMNGNPQIADFANAFIALLQSTLDVRDSIYSTVGRELKAVENYLYLQKYRYAEKFTYRVECDPDLLDCQILNVMLQPAVENAIFHGIAPKDTTERPGELLIHIEREGEQLKVQIRDDGVGMTPEVLEELMKPGHVQRGGVRKIGVANVRNRIQNIYGPPYELTIESKSGEGTCVTIVVPYRKEEQGSIEEKKEKQNSSK